MSGMSGMCGRTGSRSSARWAAIAGAVMMGSAACSSHGSVSSAAGTTGSVGSVSGGSTSAAATSAAGSSGGTSAADSGGRSGSLTPPGTHLRTGQNATLGWVPPSDFSVTEAQKGYKLQIEVVSIEKGSADDLKNIQLDADQQGSTPYFVKVRIKALEAIPASVTDNPDATLDAIDDRGQQQGSVIFLGKFDRCDDADPPKPFGAGKSFETCLTYLMPGGGAITKMQWGSGPSTGDSVTPYFDKPVSWE